MNDDLSTVHKLDELLNDIAEDRLIREKLTREAMDGESASIDVALWINVVMKGAFS